MTWKVGPRTAARYGPSGLISHPDNPRSWATDIYIALGVCLGIAAIFVVLRLYVKLAITRMKGWDDCEFLHTAILLEANSGRGMPYRTGET